MPESASRATSDPAAATATPPAGSPVRTILLATAAAAALLALASFRGGPALRVEFLAPALTGALFALQDRLLFGRGRDPAPLAWLAVPAGALALLLRTDSAAALAIALAAMAVAVRAGAGLARLPSGPGSRSRVALFALAHLLLLELCLERGRLAAGLPPSAAAIASVAAGTLIAAALARRTAARLAIALSLLPALLGSPWVVSAVVLIGVWLWIPGKRATRRAGLAAGTVAAAALAGTLDCVRCLDQSAPLAVGVAAMRERLLGLAPESRPGYRDAAALLGAAAGLPGAIVAGRFAAELGPRPAAEVLFDGEARLDHVQPELRIAGAAPAPWHGLWLVTAATDATALADGAALAEVYVADRTVGLIRAGHETAEWSRDRRDVRASVRHRSAPTACSAARTDATGEVFLAHRYRAHLRFPLPISAATLTIRRAPGANASLVVFRVVGETR